MIIKSYEVQKNLSNLLKYNFFLLYGENFGLKKDIIESIKINSKKMMIILKFCHFMKMKFSKTKKIYIIQFIRDPYLAAKK